jgi:hypothetical protein
MSENTFIRSDKSNIQELGERIIEHCRQGFSIASFLGKANISYKFWNKLCYDYPELQEAVEVAQSEELLYWEQKLIRSISTEPFDIKVAGIARNVLNERGDLYEKIYGRNKFTSTPEDVKKRVVTLMQGNRNRDILDETKSSE